MRLQIATIAVPGLVLLSAFVPPADAVDFAWIDFGMLCALSYDFVPKRDLPIIAFGGAVLAILLLRSWTGVYLLFPHDAWRVLAHAR